MVLLVLRVREVGVVRERHRVCGRTIGCVVVVVKWVCVIYLAGWEFKSIGCVLVLISRRCRLRVKIRVEASKARRRER